MLPKGFTVLSLIFLGKFFYFSSGTSDGDYVTLGYYEQDDFKTIVNYLDKTGLVSSICL